MSVMNKSILAVLMILLTGFGYCFTYQGEIHDQGTLYTGAADFEFRLYDAVTDGNQVGMTDIQSNIDIQQGRFVVQLNQWMSEFDGSNLWLEISVSIPAGGSLNILSPRQKIDTSPYAEFSYDIDDTQIQLRVIGDCPSGQYIRVINQDGTVTCESDNDSGGDITEVLAGSALEGGGTSGSVTLNVATDALTKDHLAENSVGSSEFDATEVFGSSPVVVSSHTSTVTSVFGDTNYVLIDSLTINHNVSGKVALTGTSVVKCGTNCNPGFETSCRIGFTTNVSGTPSRYSRGYSYSNGGSSTFTKDNATVVDSINVTGQGSTTVYFKGSSASSTYNCEFSWSHIMAVFEPN